MSRQDVPTPVDAASVIVLRDGRAGLETYVVARHAKSASFAGLLVFPGGKVDPGDVLVPGDLSVCDLPPVVAARRLAPLAPEERALAQYVAAIRELFEEAGVLLAKRDQAWVDPATLGTSFLELRDELYSERTSLVGMCRRFGLLLSASALEFFAHWITPEIAPSRFDTRFFLTRLPTGQEPIHDERETSAGEWLTPRAALQRYHDGRAQMAPPTFMLLSELATHPSVDSALSAAHGRSVTTIVPRPFACDEGAAFLYPGDVAYAGGDPEQPGPRHRMITRDGRWTVVSDG